MASQELDARITGRHDLDDEFQSIAVMQQDRRPFSQEALVTPEELSLLIFHGVKKDIELGQLSYPPDIEETVRAATEFYDVYLYDTGIDRVETIHRYAVSLIDQLESGRGFEAQDAYVETYVAQLHRATEQQELELVA